MHLVNSDGGRAAAGYKNSAGDCACRAVAIVTGKSYKEVYDDLNEFTKTERNSKKRRGRSSARDGIYSATFRRYMESLGWKWKATMGIGTGCRVHMREDELPKGHIIVSLSRHYAAVIDGVLHDTYNCTRNGTRCVYGYWYLD